MIIDNNTESLCILIATKDRLASLIKLLNSIKKSTLLPQQVVIVYAGADISSAISEFSKILNIQIIRSEIASQSIQKSIGIEYIAGNFDWVLFMDDDLILQTSTLSNLIKNYTMNPNYRGYAGFGLSISNNPTINYNLVTKFILFIFSLYSFRPGSITKSGHPQEYMDQKSDTEVEWLNGISLWSSKVLNLYTAINVSLPYAAYEDVAFSHSVHQKARLLFAKNAVVSHQFTNKITSLSSQQFLYGGYLRYRFVTLNNFSTFWLLISQIIRNLKFISQCKNFSDMMYRLYLSGKLWFTLFSLSVKRIHGDQIWEHNLFKLS